MDTIEKNLKDALNLSSYEAKVYLAGLNLEQATLTELAQSADIPRTAAYPPLESLLERGLMSSVKIGKRVHYRSLDPKHLPTLLDRRKVQLEEIIQNLVQRIEIPAGNVSVQYFPGIHGLEVAGDIFLNESKSKLWKTFENPIYVTQKTGERGFDIYIERRVDKGIHSRTIIPANAQSDWVRRHMENDKKELRETVLVSPSAYPVEATVGIGGDMILMVSAKAIPFSILIKNPELARTMESIHDMVLDRYKR